MKQCLQQLTAAALVVCGCAVYGAQPEAPLKTIEFDTDEGTWMNLDVSPDGKTILFDLLGDIYTLPIAGGQAQLLRGGRNWDQMPRFSPDGTSIVFVSDADGNENLWLMHADGTHARQLTADYDQHYSSPAWARSGLYVFVRRGVPARVWTIPMKGDIASEAQLLAGSPINGPEPSADGNSMYFSKADKSGGQRLWRWELMSGEEAAVMTGPARYEFRPKVSPDGRWLAFATRRGVVTALMLRDLTTGTERELIAPITQDAADGYVRQDTLPAYAFTPDNAAVVIAAGGKIRRVDVANGRSTLIPFRAHVRQQVMEQIQAVNRIEDGPMTVRHPRWTSLTPDGRYAVYSALGQLWQSALSTQTASRLTTGEVREYMPALSPDGSQIAFVRWSDRDNARLIVMPRTGGVPRELARASLIISPTWSPDGSKLAFIDASPEASKSGNWNLRWVEAAGGAAHDVAEMGMGAAPIYRYPAIAFAPDGQRLFFTRSSSIQITNELISIPLDGGDEESVLRSPLIRQFVVSPRGDKAAILTLSDGVWVVGLPERGATPLTVDVRSRPGKAKRIGAQSTGYVSWRDDDTVIWSAANKIYQWREGELEARQIAAIDLIVPRAAPEQTIAYTGARIITMRGDTIISRGTIVVAGSRITAVGSQSSVAIPKGAKVIELPGKTIMPGFIDTHAHVPMFSWPWQASYELFPEVQPNYASILSFGVTTTFDPNASNPDVFAFAEMVESFGLPSPRVFSTGNAVSPTVSTGYADIRDIEDARRIVRDAKQAGAIMLKSYNQPRRDQRQWLLQAGREEQLRVTAEGAGDYVHDLQLAADGHSLEHNFPITSLYKDVITFAGGSHLPYTPTLSVVMGGLTEYYPTHARRLSLNKYSRFASTGTRMKAVDTEFDYLSRPVSDTHVLRAARDASRLLNAGAVVSTGSHTYDEEALHQELQRFVLGGMTPLQALRSGTLAGAQKLGLDRDLGSLEPGKLADFIVLTANPLEDITRSQSIQYVVKSGFVYDAESLTQLYPERKSLPHSPWFSEEEWEKIKAPEPAPLQMR